MIVTEEEAKTKRCHETLAPVGTADRVWHDSGPCIGSACMAWRWANDAQYAESGIEEKFLGDPNFIAGYCGKAGKP